MAGLPLSGQISLSSIRDQIFVSNTNFSLDTAENGQYVSINPCSPYKPTSANPTAISEWYGYDHKAPCNSYEYISTITDISTLNPCSQAFNPIEARNNISVFVPTGVINIGSDPGLNRLVIRNIEKFPAIRIEIRGNIQNIVSLIYVFEGNGATYVPWDLVPNTGIWGASDIKTGYSYFVSVFYNDGSGRTIINQQLGLVNPPADGYYITQTYYSASAGSVCSSTSGTKPITFEYPFVVGADVIYQDDSGVAPDGYYRMLLDPNKIYRVIDGRISAITNC